MNYLKIKFLYKLEKLYYVRIDAFEGIGVNKTSKTKECNISHYCFFLNKWFKFQPNVHNRCHNLLMMSMNLKSEKH